MSYTKQTWATGDIITADKMNHMEDGISSGGTFIVNYVYGDEADTLDKTYAEIKSAMLEGKTILILRNDSYDDPQHGYIQYFYSTVKAIEEQTYTDQEGYQDHYNVESYLGTFSADTEDGVLQLTD